MAKRATSLNDWYAQKKQQYPLATELVSKYYDLGLGCAGGAIPGGLAGGPSGALAGCASGAYIAARARAAGEVINLAVGEQFAKGVSWVQDQAFDSIKSKYPTISDLDAINLVNLGILGITEFGPEIKGFAQNTASGTLSAIKSFKDASGPKFAFADGFDGVSKFEKLDIKPNDKGSVLFNKAEGEISNFKPVAKPDGSGIIKVDAGKNYNNLEFQHLDAKERVIQRPGILKDYVREAESITGIKINDTQLSKLKNTLQEYQFGKVSTKVNDAIRDKFNNKKPALRQEWSKNTGIEWPTYQENVYDKSGKILYAIGAPYEGHHVIPVHHGGPNEWWNLVPANRAQHIQIHRKDGLEKQLFNKKKDK